MKKLTAKQKKALKRPKVRVIFESDNKPNREQIREFRNKRKSSTLCTKKHTKGRLAVA